ncbi:MAG: hypothetical protein ACIAQZ_05025 [Sedimentisphaeraceae bacterium JB056]
MKKKLTDAAILRLVGIFYLVGLPFNFICLAKHFCMAGHFQHPPYSVWSYVNDIFWTTMFALCTVISLWAVLRGARWLGAMCFVCILLRFYARGEELLLPAVIYFVWMSFKYVFVPQKVLAKKKSKSEKCVK